MVTAPAGLTRLPRLPEEPQQHQRDALVWVDRGGQWRPGVVVTSGGPAVTVRWLVNDGGRTGVDTVLWNDLAEQPRTERDRFIDSNPLP